MAWDCGQRMVICETYCKEIVNTVQGNGIHFHELATKFLEIRSLLDRDWYIQLTHIPRSANDVADCLAGLGAASIYALTRLEVPPQEVNLILVRDLLVL